MRDKTKVTNIGMVLGSAPRFGREGRLLIKVRYLKESNKSVGVLLSPRTRSRFDFTCFKKVNDSVEVVELPEVLMDELKHKFKDSFLYGKESFSVCLFDPARKTTS